MCGGDTSTVTQTDIAAEQEVCSNYMAGITNYYHGESGFVANCGYDLSKKEPVYVLHLQNDPHRELTYAYGGDIHIDPFLETGDEAKYVRVDRYGGIWVRVQDQYYPELQRAISRVIEEQRDWYTNQVGRRLTKRVIPDETQHKIEKDSSELPATEASFFLSFSSKNVLLARRIFEDLKRDAKVEVWFDLDQEGESPEHNKRIERWLREAVYNSQGFVLLWTKAAKESRWVQKEILWASEKAARDPNFHFVVLKLDDEPIPPNLIETRYLVDCHNLWPMHGIDEELFAAIARRPGKIAWIEEHLRRGIEPEDDENSILYGDKHGYEPFRSDSGVAISVRHWEEEGEFCWRLDYEKEHKLHKAYGRGEAQIIDLEICSGDDVGFFIYNGWPLWMRSRSLQIVPSNIIANYIQTIEAK